MKTKIESKTLARIVKLAGSNIPRRHTLPILANVLLDVSKDRQRFTVTGTDMDVVTSVSVPMVSEVHGRVAVPKAKLESAAKACKGETELLSDRKFNVQILNGSTFNILGLSAKEFPTVPIVASENFATVSADAFKLALRNVEYAQSTDETRYGLNGLHFELFEPEILRLVATDGRRLAVAEVERYSADHNAKERHESAPAQIEKFTRLLASAKGCGKSPLIELVNTKLNKALGSLANFILPIGAVETLHKALPAESVSVTIHWNESQAKFSWTDLSGQTVEIVSKRIDGNYPNWRQVVPTDLPHVVRFNRVEFLDALKAAQQMTTEKSNSVKLSFAANVCTVTAGDPELGEFKKRVACDYAGEEKSAAYNPRYLIDPLAALKDHETVTWQFTDELSPGKLSVPGLEYVVMPMRLS